MKRILIISPMPPLVGGVAISSGRLYDNLQEDGYDVHSYNIRPKGKWWNTPVGIVLRFFGIPFWILFQKRFNVVHCHVPGTYRKLYLSLAKPFFFKGAKLIYTLHGDVAGLMNKRALYALSKADRLICVQPGDSQRLPACVQGRSVDIPAFILPKSIEETEIPADVLVFAKKHVKPLMLFYGSVVLSEQYHDLYGVEDILELYVQLKRRGIQIQMLMLVFVKNENENFHFMDKVREVVKDDPDVMLVENVRMPMLPLFKYANVYVRPTKTDGDSLAVREALGLKCPVVASDKAIRPEGTFVYHTRQELLSLTMKCIDGRGRVVEQPDFYRQIEKMYLCEK